MCFQHTLKFKYSTCYLLLYTISQSYSKHVFFLNSCFTFYEFSFTLFSLFLILTFFFPWLFPFILLVSPEPHLSWLLHLTEFSIFNYLSLYNFPFSLRFLSALLFPLRTLQSLYKNVTLASANLIFPFCLVLLLFSLMRMRSGWRLRTEPASFFSTTCLTWLLRLHIYVHVWLSYNNNSNILPLCYDDFRLPMFSHDFPLPNFSDDSRLPMISDDFRWLPKTIKLICMTVRTKLTANAAYLTYSKGRYRYPLCKSLFTRNSNSFFFELIYWNGVYPVDGTIQLLNNWRLTIKRQFEENCLEVPQNDSPEEFDPIIIYSKCFPFSNLCRMTTAKNTASENPWARAIWVELEKRAKNFACFVKKK